MSDEESFVILDAESMASANSEKLKRGDSAAPSMPLVNGTDTVKEQSCAPSSMTAEERCKMLWSTADHSEETEKIQNGCAEAEKEPIVINFSDDGKLEMDNLTKSELADLMQKSASSGSSKQSQKLELKSNGDDKSALAASFLMGEVDAEVLKTSIYSQLPATSTMYQSGEKDLQGFLNEYVELKTSLKEVNQIMQKCYERTQQWRQEDVAARKNYEEQLAELQKQVDTLSAENVALKSDLQHRVNFMEERSGDLYKNTEYLLDVESKNGKTVGNLVSKVDRLENQISSALIPKFEENKLQTIDELQSQNKELTEKLAGLTERLEHNDEEIKSLKLHMIEAETQLASRGEEITSLKQQEKANAVRYSKLLEYNKTLKQEIEVVHQQLKVYREDFEAERAARQNIAGERDKILQDLCHLQRKNQELIGELGKRFEARSSPLRTTVVLTKSPIASRVARSADCVCPVCQKNFPNINELQVHVNDCVDKLA